jgi:leader peptidase (prepilin peptidase) / N-methyltransferase
VIETIFWASAAGIFGLTVGSFLNVCAYRWPNDLSVVSPRSRCPTCEIQIRWYDNIPVLSWIILRGKCRDCLEPISIQYPLVEFATALIWVGTFWYAGPTWEAGRGAFFLTVLFGIALTDARYYIIPDEFSLGAMLVGLAASFLPGGIGQGGAFIGAALGFSLLWAVAALGKLAFKKDAMGGGDVKMMAMIGAFLGPGGVVLTIFLGALLGSVIFGPISWKTGKLVPFGIFLAAGAAVSYGWGAAIILWYQTQMLGL